MSVLVNRLFKSCWLVTCCIHVLYAYMYAVLFAVKFHWHLCKTKTSLNSDSCFWSSASSRVCSRKLINTDENLLFVLTRKNQCDDAYEIAIKKGDSVLFDATMLAKSRIKVTPRKEDKKLNDILRGWYLSLSVDIENKKSRAKVIFVYKHV